MQVKTEELVGHRAFLLHTDFPLPKHPMLKHAIESIEGVEPINHFYSKTYSWQIEAGELFDRATVAYLVEQKVLSYMEQQEQKITFTPCATNLPDYIEPQEKRKKWKKSDIAYWVVVVFLCLSLPLNKLLPTIATIALPTIAGIGILLYGEYRAEEAAKAEHTILEEVVSKLKTGEEKISH